MSDIQVFEVLVKILPYLLSMSIWALKLGTKEMEKSF